MTIRVATMAMVIALVARSATALDSRPSEGNPVPVGMSDDKTYGYSESNPVRVGRAHGGPGDSELFLASLRGAEGQKVTFKRLGSCCFFKTPNAWVGDEAPLDRYEIRYKSLKEPLILYMNIYDYEQPRVPVGLTKLK